MKWNLNDLNEAVLKAARLKSCVLSPRSQEATGEEAMRAEIEEKKKKSHFMVYTIKSGLSIAPVSCTCLSISFFFF